MENPFRPLICDCSSSRGNFEHFKTESGWRSLLTIDAPYLEEKEREAEICFPRDSTRLRLKGQSFTHLKMKTPIDIHQAEQIYHLSVRSLEGQGDFSFHLSYGKPMEGDLIILALKSLRRDDRIVFEFQWEFPSSSS